MHNNAYTQQALANDHTFRTRLQAALAKIAWQVIGEDTATANHAQRRNYANQVLQNLPIAADILAPAFVMRTNVLAFTTSYDFTPPGSVVTASPDADIESQLATD